MQVAGSGDKNRVDVLEVEHRAPLRQPARIVALGAGQSAVSRLRVDVADRRDFDVFHQQRLAQEIAAAGSDSNVGGADFLLLRGGQIRGRRSRAYQERSSMCHLFHRLRIFPVESLITCGQVMASRELVPRGLHAFHPIAHR